MYIYMWWGVGTFEGVCPGLPDDIQHGWPYTILLPYSIRIHLQHHMLLIPATFQKLYGGPWPQGYPLGLKLPRSKRPCFWLAAIENTVGLTVRFFHRFRKSNRGFVWKPIHSRRGPRTIDPDPPMGTAILPCPRFPYKLIFHQSGPGGLSRWHVCTRG
jgi:hypothetical protein